MLDEARMNNYVPFVCMETSGRAPSCIWN